MQGKVVDFAMIFDPPYSISEIIVDKIASQGSKSSINQSAAEWVRFTPIGISFETKRQGEGGDTVYVPISTWLSAHFAKLLQLIDRRTKLPCLLGLIVQGHTWSMVIAVIKESGKGAPTTAYVGATAERGQDEEEEQSTVLKRKVEVFRQRPTWRYKDCCRYISKPRCYQEASEMDGRAVLALVQERGTWYMK